MANYYNYNNVKFLVNNQSILADSLTFSQQTKVVDARRYDQRGGFRSAAEGGIDASLNVTYFLTGADPLRALINSETSAVFEVAGMTLQKGYLNNYSFTAQPFGPVQVNANISLYEDFGGAFQPTVLPEADYDYLKFSDMEITLQGIDVTSKIRSLNYAFSCEMFPVYRGAGGGDAASPNTGDLEPSEIRYGPKKTNLSLDTYNFREALPYMGKDVTIDFTIGPEVFQTKGILKSKDAQFTFGQKLASTLSIEATSYGGQPTITNDAPSGPSVGGVFTIHGTNLSSTTAVYFHNNIKANKFKSISDTKIEVYIPRFSATGPYRVVTAYGEIVRPSITINNPINVP